MRLIDADVVQSIADNELYVNDASIVQFVLSHTPTIDAMPIVHGKWEATIIEVSDRTFRTGAPHCSLCGCQAYNRTIFCPHCGAKMDGDG